jgi:HEPN domain-containing protein
MALLDQEASKNFLEHISRLWFNPELETQRLIGLVEEGYQPGAMQVILFPDGLKHILFDNLVIPKEKLEANIKYRDCGHVTFKKDPYGNWKGFFDFRYNKGKAEELFNTSLQFFETAKEAYEVGRSRVFLDNIFSSAELLVESMLFVMTPNQEYVKDPNHNWTKRELGRAIKVGLVESRYSKTLGNLSDLRRKARYHRGQFSLEEPKAQELIRTLDEWIQEVQREIS